MLSATSRMAFPAATAKMDSFFMRTLVLEVSQKFNDKNDNANNTTTEYYI